MSADKINLPETIDGWRLEDPPRRIDKANIFDYMDGAGELYLSYNFDCLLVHEYKDEGDNEILVEIYRMKGPRDAFGLLSLDWGGEAVKLNPPDADRFASPVIPSSRALYGQGLLRAWSDDLYVRVLAYRESPPVKEVVLRLGGIIAAGRDNPPPPGLLRLIDPSPDSPWVLRKDRTAYFYSHLVLNSLFYLSHENILNLGPSTEAVIVTFEKGREGKTKLTARLLVVQYPDDERASKGWTDFAGAYLPDKEQEGDSFQIEDGWLGYRLAGRYLALALVCPDRESAQEILSRAVLK